MSDYRGDEFRIEPPPSATTGALSTSLPESSRRGLIPYIAVGMAAVAFAGFLWYAYRQNGATATDGTVPEVRADANPFKTQPPNPGGMQVPHQDSTLLNRAPAETATETLLAPPDVPEARPEPAPETVPTAVMPAETAEPETETITQAPAPAMPPAPVAAVPAPVVPAPTPAPAQPAIGAIEPAAPAATRPMPIIPRPAGPAANPTAAGNPRAAPNPAVATAPLPPPDTPAGEIAAELNKPEPAPVATAAITPPPAPRPQPAAQAQKPVAATAGGSWAVQIGAVRSDADAKSEWKRLQRKHKPQLGGLALTVKSANLGDRGTWYRIQGGPLDKTTAARVCGELKAADVGCLVVRH